MIAGITSKSPLLGAGFLRPRAVSLGRLIHIMMLRMQSMTLAPGQRHWTLFRQMLIEGQAHGSLTCGARLAALTIEFGGVLHTPDRDFTRFPGLR